MVHDLSVAGYIVIAGGGGGPPVYRDPTLGLEGIDAVLGRDDVIAGAFEKPTGDLADGERIVDDQHRWYRGDSLGSDGRSRSLRTWGAARLVGRERDRIYDKRDVAVAQHRSADDTGHTGELGTDVLDYDFLVAEQRVARKHIVVKIGERHVQG